MPDRGRRTAPVRLHSAMRKAPLIASALTGVAVIAVGALGCGSDERPPADRTTLSITAVWPTGRTELRLTCDPAGGGVPEASRVCETLANHPVMLFPPALTASCAGSEGVPPAFDVT